MSKAQHTPGPWEYEPDGDRAYVGIPHTKAGEQYIRCIPVESGCADDEDYANARLIAAAPELLEAAMEMAMLLENALRIGAIDKNLIIAETIRSALPIHRAAIAKATGE